MGDSNGSTKSLPNGTIAKLTCDILDGTFYNIIHDIVAKVHRDEKIARMRSAVTIARQRGEEEARRLREGTAGKATPAVPAKPGDPEAEAQSFTNIRVETEGAIFDEGKVYLKGNPLKTTKEIICPDCRLPRLLYPVAGIGARPPPDPSREYCQRQPLISKPGHDVHGNPFAVDKTQTKKKKKDKDKETTTSNTPASSPPGTPESGASKEILFPTVKCPNCPRYFGVTRFAMHLDRCMGLSSRGTGRTRTPADSGSATPNPASNPPKRPLVDEDGSSPSGVFPKKKKLNGSKKPIGKKPSLPSKLKNGTTPDMAAAADAEIKSEAVGEDN
ncbi:hypothetical protein ASPZODRAFT_1222291 [Penicilliopsis zonata CBS 506.65]|uniref:SAGA-associated factor 11 n=1 Tax=Penicilliopsis zonata CBS 506.65 TaxID=1073090 RepID=A0A1L9S7I7_9EURO|nr:hypothetical protein ASPZODRAFT_1222291 [Penicilliopsis zonata CBS 506.65]OJJ43125.1 hypothetical protein ASPZODRAFT_1222291 [Penicilliopsis zonata CBS 506.65]